MQPLGPIAIEEIEAAARRLAVAIVRTPLLRLEVGVDTAEIWLKPECLQPIGSFKLRGAENALAVAGAAALRSGVVTASAGNMAQGVAWGARRRGVPATAVVPQQAPATKLAAIERLGGRVVRVPYDAWWRVLETGSVPDLPGLFVHPVCDRAVIAGHGTIGLEILEDLPEVDTVIVPFGGGGLVSGIASALRAKRPKTRVLAAEVESAAPLAASFAAGAPRAIEHQASFVDGIGGKGVLPAMWPLVSSLVAESLVVSLADVASAVRRLVERNRLVAEGAGAAPVAAALSGRAGLGKIVCVVSGGNIDSGPLASILAGRLP